MGVREGVGAGDNANLLVPALARGRGFHTQFSALPSPDPSRFPKWEGRGATKFSDVRAVS